MKAFFSTLVLILSASAAMACDLSVQATNAWVRPTIGDVKQTAVYMDIKNTGDDAVTLTSVSSPQGTASLHESMNHEGMMHMEALPPQAIKPGETLSFSPGHKHVMLEQLKKPLKAGDKVKLTLYFSDDTSTTLTIPVASKAVEGEAKQSHHH